LSLIFVVYGQIGTIIPSYSIDFTATSQDVAPPDGSAGSCSGTISYDSTDSTISGSLSCTGLSSGTTFTAAHIHTTSSDYNCGSSGPVLWSILPSGGTGPTTFSKIAFDSTVGNIDDICYGYTYINVHTTAFGGGEVRINLVDAYGSCKTGQTAQQRTATAGPTQFPPYPYVPTTGEYPGFSNYFTCGTSPSCLFSFAFEYDWGLYIGGNCTGLVGNVTSVNAASQDSTSTYDLYYNDDVNPCGGSSHFSGEYSGIPSNSDITSLCAPTSGSPWVLTVLTDLTTEKLTCSFPKTFCPATYQPGSPNNPASGPTPSGTTPPPPQTGAANIFSVTMLFTLFFSLISLWLN